MDWELVREVCVIALAVGYFAIGVLILLGRGRLNRFWPGLEGRTRGTQRLFGLAYFALSGLTLLALAAPLLLAPLVLIVGALAARSARSGDYAV